MGLSWGVYLSFSLTFSLSFIFFYLSRIITAVQLHCLHRRLRRHPALEVLNTKPTCSLHILVPHVVLRKAVIGNEHARWAGWRGVLKLYRTHRRQLTTKLSIAHSGSACSASKSSHRERTCKMGGLQRRLKNRTHRSASTLLNANSGSIVTASKSKHRERECNRGSHGADSLE